MVMEYPAGALVETELDTALNDTNPQANSYLRIVVADSISTLPQI